jgi:hypothetical protein
MIKKYIKLLFYFSMDKDRNFLEMGMNTSECLEKEKNKDKEYSILEMEMYIEDNLKMIK